MHKHVASNSGKSHCWIEKSRLKQWFFVKKTELKVGNFETEKMENILSRKIIRGNLLKLGKLKT